MSKFEKELESDNLIKKIISSSIFKESFANQNVKKRLSILKEIIDFELRKIEINKPKLFMDEAVEIFKVLEISDGFNIENFIKHNKSTKKQKAYLDETVDTYKLIKKIQQNYNLDGAANDFVAFCKNKKHQIASIYQSLTSEYTTTIRVIYTDIIAELIYEENKETINKFKI